MRAFLHHWRRIIRRYQLRIVLLLARLKPGSSTVIYGDDFLRWVDTKKQGEWERENNAKKCHEKCQNNGVKPHITVHCAMSEYHSKVHKQWHENHLYLLGPIAFLFGVADDILEGLVDKDTREKIDEVKDKFNDSE